VRGESSEEGGVVEEVVGEVSGHWAISFSMFSSSSVARESPSRGERGVEWGEESAAFFFGEMFWLGEGEEEAGGGELDFSFSVLLVFSFVARFSVFF
jgi:hypothetical protein